MVIGYHAHTGHTGLPYLCLMEIFSCDVIVMTYDLVLKETSVFVEFAIGCVVTITIDKLPPPQASWTREEKR